MTTYTEPTAEIRARLEDLRAQIDAECISYGELAELASLAPYIHPTDVQLLQWAGVPEFPCDICGERDGTRDINDLTGNHVDCETGPDAPEESDYVSSDGGHTYWQDNRVVVGYIDDPDEATAQLRAHADREQFWPGAWLISDHGNAIPTEY